MPERTCWARTVTGARSYPGLVFGMQPDVDNGEHVYVGPHRAELYPDAVQYAPIVNGIGSWQLCNGDGFTAATELPADRWVHPRLPGVHPLAVC